MYLKDIIIEKKCLNCGNLFKTNSTKQNIKRKFCCSFCKTSFIGKNNKNKKVSIKTKKNMSISQYNRWSNLEERKKQSNRFKGENNPFYGKVLSKEHIEKRTKTGINRGSWKGDKNHMTGNGYKVKGENNPFYGKEHSEKSKLKMSKTKCELLSSGKLNLIQNFRGKKGWYYSNKNNEKFYYDSLLEKYRMEILDKDITILNWTKRHKIKILYKKGNIGNRYYVPDFLIKYKNGNIVLEEIKGYDTYYKQKKNALIKYCKKNKLIYRWIDQKDLGGYKEWKKDQKII